MRQSYCEPLQGDEIERWLVVVVVCVSVAATTWSAINIIGRCMERGWIVVVCGSVVTFVSVVAVITLVAIAEEVIESA